MSRGRPQSTPTPTPQIKSTLQVKSSQVCSRSRFTSDPGASIMTACALISSIYQSVQAFVPKALHVRLFWVNFKSTPTPTPTRPRPHSSPRDRPPTRPQPRRSSRPRLITALYLKCSHHFFFREEMKKRWMQVSRRSLLLVEGQSLLYEENALRSTSGSFPISMDTTLWLFLPELSVRRPPNWELYTEQCFHSETFLFKHDREWLQTAIRFIDFKYSLQ